MFGLLHCRVGCESSQVIACTQCGNTGTRALCAAIACNLGVDECAWFPQTASGVRAFRSGNLQPVSRGEGQQHWRTLLLLNNRGE